MQNNNDEKSPIDELQEDLYSREKPSVIDRKRSKITETEYDVNTNWSGVDQEFQANLESGSEEKSQNTFFHKLLTSSVIFFFIAVLVATYLFFAGFNNISSNNIDISINGLISVAAGEELVLDIVVQNNNSVDLTDADILIEYPPGTRIPKNIGEELLRDKQNLGTILAGKSVGKTVSAVLFGEKNSIKDIKITMEYKAKGSNAVFSKDKLYQISINSSPVVLVVDYPKEVNANQDIMFSATITSNSNNILENLLVRVDYPFGFVFQNATPLVLFDNNVWKLGDLKPKEKRTITIRGKMQGQNEEEKTFRFHIGTASSQDEKLIGIDFITVAESVSIKKPFIGLVLDLNGNTNGDYISNIGEVIQGNINLTNNISVDVNNVRVEAKLTGNALDRSAVFSVGGGFFRSLDNIISWDKNNTTGFGRISPGGANSLQFNFSSLKNSSSLMPSLRNGSMNIDIVVIGKKFSDVNLPDEVLATLSRQIKIVSDIRLNSQMVHSVGPFTNTGSIPPSADRETTYTVKWAITNSFNDVSNVEVVGTLPSYVKLVDGAVSPTGQKITFNPANNTVTWSAGEIKAGTGFGSSPTEVGFKVSFLPSLSQVGSVPTLLDNISLVGQDRFTGSVLRLDRPTLNTRITTDPSYKFGDEKVVK